MINGTVHGPIVNADDDDRVVAVLIASIAVNACGIVYLFGMVSLRRALARRPRGANESIFQRDRRDGEIMIAMTFLYVIIFSGAVLTAAMSAYQVLMGVAGDRFAGMRIGQGVLAGIHITCATAWWLLSILESCRGTDAKPRLVVREPVRRNEARDAATDATDATSATSVTSIVRSVATSTEIEDFEVGEEMWR